MKITITGASGLVGRRLLKTFGDSGYAVHVLSRSAGASLPAGIRISAWDPEKGAPPEEALSGAGAVIHLAGETVAQRWTAESKRRILDSRVSGTHNLVEAMSAMPKPPGVLVSASAIGFYGDRGDEPLTESSEPGAGFLSEVAKAAEREARTAEARGIRVICMRTGIALDPRGGALGKMLPAFRMGLGGKMGSGGQWVSWIHAEDLAGLFRFVVENPLGGAMNAVSPYPERNADFARQLGRALGRPAVLPLPGFALRLLFGEMSEMLLESQRVTPDAALAAGFRFRFAQLPEALADLLQ